MSKQKYPEEFKIEAVKQITERGHKVADVSARLGVSQHSLYQWIKRYTLPVEQRQTQTSQTDELRRLKAELKRVIEERDILKNVRSQAIVEISLMAGSLYGVRVWLYFGPPCGAVALWAGSHIGASR